MDFESLGTLFIGGIMAWQWYTEQKKKKNKPDLSDPDYDDLIGEDLDDIGKNFESIRCTYWSFTNGTITADGYSNKSLSMMAERNRYGVDNLIREMQNIPTMNFKRNLNLLRDAESLIICYEHNKEDALGKFHRYYGFNTNIFVKVYNGNRWTGILGLNFEDLNIEFPEEKLAWLTFQASKIGNKLKSFSNK